MIRAWMILLLTYVDVSQACIFDPMCGLNNTISQSVKLLMSPAEAASPKETG